MCALHVKVDNILHRLPVGTPEGRGPTGLHRPRGTGPYYRPATRTANSLASLQTALAASSSGDVIEMTAGFSGTITDTGTTGSWTENVLVRPPLGTRLTCSSTVIIGCPKVTVAGFDFPTVIGSVEAPRAAFWRCVFHTGINGPECQLRQNAPDGGFYECIWPEVSINLQGASVDLMHITANGADLVNPIIEGCYFNARLRGPSTVRHAFTLPSTLAVQTNALSWTADTTFSGDLALIAYLDVPPQGQPVAFTIKKNGTAMQSVTVNVSPDWQYSPLFNGITGFSVTAGDVLAIDITQVGNVSPGSGLSIWIGESSAAHVDVMQCFGTNGGRILDMTIRDSIIHGSDNRPFQTANHFGEVTYDNNWWGNLHNSVFIGQGTSPDRREHVVYNTFNSTTDFFTAGSLMTILHNQAVAYNMSVDPSNTQITASAIPPLPDLTKNWPECPWSP